MNSNRIKTWAWVHRWSSLVCTVFMLLLCITGLPLIFHHEIGHLLGREVEAPKMSPGTPRASLDRVIEVAHALHPDRVVQFVSHPEDDDNVWFVTLTPTPAPTDDFKSVAVDARTAQVLAQPRFDEGFMYVMLKLHVDLFAGLPGKLFLGFMGLLLLVAIVSGVVLYSPFMRKLDFGTVRRERRPRLKWLDLHNLLGIVTLAWAFTVGATGMINTWADLIIKYWQYDQLSALLAPYQGQPPVAQAQRGSVQRSLDVALERAPRQQAVVHCVSGHRVFEPASQHRIPARKRAVDIEAAPARAGRRADGRRHRQSQAAVVSHGAAGFAAPSFRRLRRHAHADPVGAARCRDHHRARQRALPVAQAREPRAGARGEARGPGGLRAFSRGREGGRMTRQRNHFWRVWGWPVVLGLLTCVGLVSALFSNGGLGDAVAWVALGVPVGTCVWFGWYRSPNASKDKRR